MLYFAFGSNMSSERLVARVGEVRALGHAILDDHRHRFNKLGYDGTGKGNVEPAPGREVHGVLYDLSADQLAHLATYEGGYHSAQLCVRTPDGRTHTATSFIADDPTDDLLPCAVYLAHYMSGIDEHDLPGAYVDEILAAAGAATS